MFTAGDVVYLSSRPNLSMTIERVDIDSCYCVWFDQNNKLNRDSFLKESLKLKDIPYTIPEVISFSN